MSNAKVIPLIDLKSQYQRLKDRIDARIAAVLAHGTFIMGPEVAELEAQLARFSGVRHAITCSNGTDALIMVLRAKGIGPGDAVFMPAFTFTATAEAALVLGAQPVFVDVEVGSFNIDCAHLEAAITRVRQQGRLKPAAVMAVDLFGLPADYAELNRISAREGLYLLADAAQSYGASRDNRRVGALAPATATSFFPAKPLGCYGDGGAIFTDDDDLAHVLRSIRQHGKGDEKYDIVRIGMNARLDTVQAAVLLAKLEIFEWEIERRQQIAAGYNALLAGKVEVPRIFSGSISAWAQYTVMLDGRDAVAARLKAAGIPTAVYYPKPMHLQPAYAEFGDGPGSLLVSERLSANVLSLPMHPYLDDRTVDHIAGAVIAAVS